MIRSLSLIISAILLTQPKMAPSTAKSYAQVVRKEAIEHHFDPYTMVSMVHYESRWRSGVGNGTCFGLGGICVTNYRVCQADRQSDACMAKQNQLLDGAHNLRVAADHITANRRFCRKKTGSARFHHWLASYQGYNKPGAGIWCGQRKRKGKWVDVKVQHLTKRVMDRRRMLMRRGK